MTPLSLSFEEEENLIATLLVPIQGYCILAGSHFKLSRSPLLMSNSMIMDEIAHFKVWDISRRTVICKAASQRGLKFILSRDMCAAGHAAPGWMPYPPDHANYFCSRSKNVVCTLVLRRARCRDLVQ